MNEGQYHTEAYHKITKLPIHWLSKIHKRHKENAIKVNLIDIKNLKLILKKS